jgi:glycerate 2-kinase
MNILIAPDKFKGTLSALEAAQAMAEGVAKYNPDWSVRLLPIADGGEGTAELLTHAYGGAMVRTQASDALFRAVTCSYGISKDGATAFIDLAEASGMQRLLPEEVNALRTSTIGTGQLIGHAISKKCKRIVLGLGGSATIDCGTGIAHALGILFLDDQHRMVSPIGGNLGQIEFIEDRARRLIPGKVELILLADVMNPLLGDEGVMHFASQKGIQGDNATLLAAKIRHFANFMEAKYGWAAKTPGMGAAGGAAVVCTTLLGGKIAPGADFVLDVLGANQAIADADIVLTGEGHLDAQSLLGKATISLARRAEAQGKPVVAICGQISLGMDEQMAAGIRLSGALYRGEADWEKVQHESYKELVLRTGEMLAEFAPSLKR